MIQLSACASIAGHGRHLLRQAAALRILAMMLRQALDRDFIARVIVTLALTLGAGSWASAGECAGHVKLYCRTCCLPTAQCCCADTYCPKPLPCVTCQPMCCADCYCPKPMPMVCCQPLCCPDSYCCKPFPDLCYAPVANCTCGPCDRGHCSPLCKSRVPGACAAVQTAAAPAETKVELRGAEKQSPAEPVAVPAAKRVMRMKVR